MAFMPFITAGDPDLDMTKAVIEELARQKVDLIEVGFPYSDPIADGPVIQASYTRALAKGLHVANIFGADCGAQGFRNPHPAIGGDGGVFDRVPHGHGKVSEASGRGGIFGADRSRPAGR